MSFNQVLDELPALTIEQRQVLIRRAVKLDDAPLSEADTALVEARLAAHQANLDSSVPLAEMKVRLRPRFKS